MDRYSKDGCQQSQPNSPTSVRASMEFIPPPDGQLRPEIGTLDLKKEPKELTSDTSIEVWLDAAHARVRRPPYIRRAAQGLLQSRIPDRRPVEGHDCAVELSKFFLKQASSTKVMHPISSVNTSRSARRRTTNQLCLLGRARQRSANVMQWRSRSRTGHTSTWCSRAALTQY